jgi:hypothetical protein
MSVDSGMSSSIEAMNVTRAAAPPSSGAIPPPMFSGNLKMGRFASSNDESKDKSASSRAINNYSYYWSAREECESSLTMKIRCGRKMLMVLIPMLMLMTVAFNLSVFFHHLRDYHADDNLPEEDENNDDATDDDAYVKSLAHNASLSSGSITTRRRADVGGRIFATAIKKPGGPTLLERQAAASEHMRQAVQQTRQWKKQLAKRKKKKPYIKPNPNSLSSDATFSAWYVCLAVQCRLVNCFSCFSCVVCSLKTTMTF